LQSNRKPEHLDPSALSFLDHCSFERTALLFCSHVHESSGFRTDLVELGQLRHPSNHLVVDVSNSLGVLEVDVRKMHIDGCIGCSHRFLLGTPGVAFCYISKRHVPSGLAAVEKRFRSAQFDDPPRHCAILALGVALSMIREVGISHIEEHVLHLNRYLCARLQELAIAVTSPVGKQKHRSAIVVIAAPPTLSDECQRHRVVVGKTTNGIQVSLHGFVSHTDIDRFVDALVSILTAAKASDKVLKLAGKVLCLVSAMQ
jgi:selenocysteine lyase/cysteine desulfurase